MIKKICFILIFFYSSQSFANDNLNGTYVYCNNPEFTAWKSGFEFLGPSTDEGYNNLIEYNINLNTEGLAESQRWYIAYFDYISIFSYNYIEDKIWLWGEFDRNTLGYKNIINDEYSNSGKVCSVMDSKEELINKMISEFENDKTTLKKKRKI